MSFSCLPRSDLTTPEGAEPYQRAARDGLDQRVEDVDGKTQQGRPAVHDGLVRVVLEEERRSCCLIT